MKPIRPMQPMDFGPAWWPGELGSPNASGGQPNVQYAFFANKRRLAIKRGDHVTVYDSGDHEVAGISQSRDGSASISIVSQHGTVNIGELAQV